MPIFEMIGYGRGKYPDDIPINVKEVACHFDTEFIASETEYSLHTEYSYGKRKFKNPLLQKYSKLNMNEKEIPLLWCDKEWSKEFAYFIIEMTSKSITPKYIEVHPPFSNYTRNIGEFVDRYEVFENIILNQYPNTKILIENRSGSLYGKEFVISRSEQMLELGEIIEDRGLNLRMILDVPQIYTAHAKVTMDEQDYSEILYSLIGIRHLIGGVHLWGKRTGSTGRWMAHKGDLNSYFRNKEEVKDKCLSALFDLFDDGLTRNMVLEVNDKNEYLLSIIDDLMSKKFTFI